MNTHEIVCKIVGPIEPIGETNSDNQRLENLKVMTELVGQLLCDLHEVSRYKSRVEYSMKIAGEHASKFIYEIGIIE